MSRAKALIERMCPMPVITPEPGTKPKTAPSPSRPTPSREKPNPFRRGKVKPGEEPRPKARMESQGGSLARSLIEDSDFVARMKAAREAKKNGGKAPEDNKDMKGGDKKPAASKGGSATPKSGDKVKHAFNK